MKDDMFDTVFSLGKSCIDSKHFKWVPGMLAQQYGKDGSLVYETRVEKNKPKYIPNNSPAVPNVMDPATQGCLLSLIREAIDDPFVSVLYRVDKNVWEVRSPWIDPSVAQSDASIGEALVRALYHIE